MRLRQSVCYTSFSYLSVAGKSNPSSARREADRLPSLQSEEQGSSREEKAAVGSFSRLRLKYSTTFHEKNKKRKEIRGLPPSFANSEGNLFQLQYLKSHGVYATV